MSLQIAAQHLASKGRGPDTELVHMTKGEIAGLQSLALAHGGSLTINPHTGLAEAGFLSSILPALAGAAAMYFTGGMATPFLGLGAGGVGALAGAATGYLQNPKGGLGSLAMGALGGYGGGSIGGGLMDYGVAAGAPTVPTAAQAAAQAAAQPNLLAPAIATAPIPTGLDAMAAGAKNIMGSPGAAFDFARGNLSGLGAIAAPIAAGMTPNYKGAPAQDVGNITPYTFTRDVDNSDPRNPTVNQYYTAGTPVKAPGPAGFPYQPGQVIRMADGGVAGNGRFPQSDMPQVNYASDYQQPIQENVLNNMPQTRVDPNTGSPLFAQGGIASLGSYSDGGQLLKGPGDGVSDNIPAVIGKSQPARLANNEFVIPARIVSELGNGSTDAGAKELYKMMARVQKARSKTVGKNQIAVDSKARNLLPA